MGRWALDVAFVWKAVLTLGLVLLYYCFSIGITFYNKWLTKSFHFPLFMTMLHLAVIFLFSALSRALVQCSSHRARVVLSWPDYLRRVAPTALATALDVGLSNWSFLYITVSLYTMTKSSAVLFILIFSLIFKLEELRAALVLVVLLIAGGLFMFTYKSTQFNMEGFALVLGASFIGGIRWTLTQILLQKAELGLQNPIDTMFHLQPLMFLGLFPLFAIFEGGPPDIENKRLSPAPHFPVEQGGRPQPSPDGLSLLFLACQLPIATTAAKAVGSAHPPAPAQVGKECPEEEQGAPEDFLGRHCPCT
ncbi:solute carrier family 35 member C2 isoform 2-T4 [Glossophaga mutica]